MLSWHSIRRSAVLFLVPVLVLSGWGLNGVDDARTMRTSESTSPQAQVPTPVVPPTAGGPGTGPAPTPPTVRTRQTTVPSPRPGAGRRVVAELPETRTSSYGMVGVTWSAEAAPKEVVVEFRSLVKGDWTAWQRLEVEDENPGTGGRPGTEPIWVGRATGVAVRVSSASGAKPADIRVVTIDPGETRSTNTSTTGAETASGVTPAGYRTDGIVDGTAQVATVATYGDGAPAFTSKPTVITRKTWGASAGTTCSAPLTGDSTHGVVVHQTAGNNSYAASDSAGIVRGIQAYHVKGHGWCDIGYNFLVDKYGQIFEGRKGGMDRPVRAAHSGNGEVNTFTMGVSMMGDFDKVVPSPALKTSVVKLAGWRLGTNFMKAKGTYGVSENNLTLNRIAGHRNVVSTACPGRYGYAWLSEAGGLRDRVEAYIAGYTSPIKTLRAELGTAKTGPVFIGEHGSSTNRKATLKYVDLYSKTGLGAFSTSGKIRTEYNRIGSQTGPLAYPETNGAATSITGLTRQRFERGLIYARSGVSGAFSLSGDISMTYRSLGAHTGRLGPPTSSIRTVSSGVTRANFERGYIVRTASTGKTVAYSSGGTVIPMTSRPPAVTGVKVAPTAAAATVTWSATGEAKTYGLCLTTGATSTSCYRSLSGITATSVKISGLAPTPGTDYYVKVRAGNSAGAGPWSPKVGFNLTTSSDAVTVPSSRTVPLTGHGYGHGIGMGQYGAQQAARSGLTYSKILAVYYPGTALGTKTGSIRVLLSQDTTDSVIVKPATGLVFRRTGGSAVRLPSSVSGRAVDQWRIVPTAGAASQSSLHYKAAGVWRSYNHTRWTGDAQFEGPSRITLVLPGGSTAAYRGALRSALPKNGATTRDTVNVLPIESYVRGVVATEMPSSWMSEALKAQAVAARTYGVRSLGSTRHYDICNTTACQVYGGVARETSSTDSAVAATAGKIVTYAGKPALTQFSSSSGGYTTAGSQPYLKAVADPYDNWSGNANHTWTTTLSASTVEKAYPSIGTLRKLAVTQRSGPSASDWGGRVTTLSLIGSKKTISITGTSARSAFGLRSTWFRF